MARTFADDAYTYRAVVVTTTTYTDGREAYVRTEYYGPYIRKGTAMVQLARVQRAEERRTAHTERWSARTGRPIASTSVVTGHVERAETVWYEVL